MSRRFCQWRCSIDGKVTTPDKTLSLEHRESSDERTCVSAGMTLMRRPITTWQLARMLVRYPWMTAKVTAGIIGRLLACGGRERRFTSIRSIAGRPPTHNR